MWYTVRTGVELRYYRELMGLSVAELAKRIHFSPRALFEYERGKEIPFRIKKEVYKVYMRMRDSGKLPPRPSFAHVRRRSS
jgi:predicted transcriptional regulator